jgi:hypothetical protein
MSCIRGVKSFGKDEFHSGFLRADIRKQDQCEDDDKRGFGMEQIAETD